MSVTLPILHMIVSSTLCENMYFFLAILNVYQQFAREKANPERHLKSHLEMQEKKKPMRMTCIEEKDTQKH